MQQPHSQWVGVAAAVQHGTLCEAVCMLLRMNMHMLQLIRTQHKAQPWGPQAATFAGFCYNPGCFLLCC